MQRVEISTTGPFADHTSVEFCVDGTLLVTTSHGDYYGAENGNALFDASVDGNGEISLLGARLSTGAQPNNSACAPGSRAGATGTGSKIFDLISTMNSAVFGGQIPSAMA